MSQHDMNIANQGFPAFRADLNDALAALASTSTGATEPSTTFAQQLWYDSTANLLKMRNTDNDAWITLAYFDQTNDEWQIRSAVIQAVDSAGVVIKTDDGTTRLTIADDGSITTQGDLTVGGDLDVSSGTIKLDGNYPTGTNNVALGNGALDDGSLTGGYNVAIGESALTANTSGQLNTCVGWSAGLANTTGSFNTFMGDRAGQNTATASENTFIGASTSAQNTTGAYNTAIGRQALQSNTTASNNTAVGYKAGYSGTIAANNTFVGYQAGYANNSGGAAYNTFIGYGSGSAVTGGYKHTIIGAYSGNQGGLDIRTANNYIVLSDGDGNPRVHVDANGRSTFKGNQAGHLAKFQNDYNTDPSVLWINTPNASPDDNSSYFMYASDSTALRCVIYSDGDIQNHDNSYGAISDVKLKEQITDASSQWDDIKALTVRKYKMKSDVTEKGDSDDLWRLGVVAQEVEAAGMSGLVKESPDRDADNNDLGTTTKQVKYSILYMKAVKALQEAMDRIETLEAKVAALESN